MSRMSNSRIEYVAMLAAAVAAVSALSIAGASAAPTAEVAKRCIHYSYMVYPYKRPGAAPMNGDRQAYVKDCFAKNGEVPEPEKPKR
jgi:hypothetical protein